MTCEYCNCEIPKGDGYVVAGTAEHTFCNRDCYIEYVTDEIHELIWENADEYPMATAIIEDVFENDKSVDFALEENCTEYEGGDNDYF